MGINHYMLKKEIPWTCSLAAVMFNDLIQVCPKESGNTCTSANPLGENRFPCIFPWQSRRMRWINWDQLGSISSVSAWAFLLLDLIDRNPVHICQPYSQQNHWSTCHASGPTEKWLGGSAAEENRCQERLQSPPSEDASISAWKLWGKCHPNILETSCLASFFRGCYTESGLLVGR